MFQTTNQLCILQFLHVFFLGPTPKDPTAIPPGRVALKSRRWWQGFKAPLVTWMIVVGTKHQVPSTKYQTLPNNEPYDLWFIMNTYELMMLTLGSLFQNFA